MKAKNLEKGIEKNCEFKLDKNSTIDNSITKNPINKKTIIKNNSI